MTIWKVMLLLAICSRKAQHASFPQPRRRCYRMRRVRCSAAKEAADGQSVR